MSCATVCAGCRRPRSIATYQGVGYCAACLADSLAIATDDLAQRDGLTLSLHEVELALSGLEELREREAQDGGHTPERDRVADRLRRFVDARGGR